MRRNATKASLSLLSSVALLCAFGLSNAHAATGVAAASKSTATLIRTGNAHLDRSTNVSARAYLAAPAGSGLNFVATYDSSITSDPNAAAITQGIQADLRVLQRLITTPETITIEFASAPTGLGGSATYYNALPYTTYRSDLAHQAKHSVFDNRARRTLPATNPVDSDTDLYLTLPLLRAIGEDALGNIGSPVDSTITLNTSIMNFSRTGTIDPDKYDLRQVAMHELSEVLGAGGGGSGLAFGRTGPLDLFRYSADGTRTHTTDPNTVAYFSINRGAYNRGYFNQDSGGDYGDWSSDLNGRPQVQDAFSTPGVFRNLDANEKIALDVVGQTLNPRSGA